jgi:hypothetical protein
MTTIETPDWKLGCFMEWRPILRSVNCPTCSGTGEIFGGFSYMSENKKCHECAGVGRVTYKPTTQRPDLPADLVEHMRRAWWDFVNKPSTGAHEQ